MLLSTSPNRSLHVSNRDGSRHFDEFIPSDEELRFAEKALNDVEQIDARLTYRLRWLAKELRLRGWSRGVFITFAVDHGYKFGTAGRQWWEGKKRSD